MLSFTLQDLSQSGPGLGAADSPLDFLLGSMRWPTVWQFIQPFDPPETPASASLLEPRTRNLDTMSRPADLKEKSLESLESLTGLLDDLAKDHLNQGQADQIFSCSRATITRTHLRGLRFRRHLVWRQPSEASPAGFFHANKYSHLQNFFKTYMQMKKISSECIHRFQK